MEGANTVVIKEFTDKIRKSLSQEEFVKLTLSKSVRPELKLKNIYVRLVSIRQSPKLSFTYRYFTNDQVKNYELEEGLEEIEKLLNDTFKIATLFTTREDTALMFSKRNKPALTTSRASYSETLPENHDREKKKRATDKDAYLAHLGITDAQGNVIPKMADKYRQINKYLEIIESLIKEATLPSEINMVDMGSGKGYLTFALYDYLHNKLNLKVKVIGIELRNELVEYCNKIAAECGFENLRFECKPIEEFKEERIDILIALHACDTATDDAILKGIVSNAALIICAPCCHKQIRQQMKGQAQENPILKYGIFKERQCEMITDTIRALIMEKKQYETKVFEFISNEHTRKNVMLVGIKSSKKVDENLINAKIESLKKEYGIEYHYLEKSLS